VDGFKTKPDAHDVVVVVGDIGVLHVAQKPTRRTCVPLGLVFPDDFFAFLVERLDAYASIALCVEAELLFQIDLKRTERGIPAGLAQNVVALMVL
jgi:hypothetical protein